MSVEEYKVSGRKPDEVVAYCTGFKIEGAR